MSDDLWTCAEHDAPDPACRGCQLVGRLNVDPEWRRQMAESEATDWSKEEAVTTEQLVAMMSTEPNGHRG